MSTGQTSHQRTVMTSPRSVFYNGLLEATRSRRRIIRPCLRTFGGLIVLLLQLDPFQFPALADNTKCRISSDVLDADSFPTIKPKHPFLFGDPPEIVGFVTERQKRFRTFVSKPGIKAWHQAIVAETRELIGDDPNELQRHAYIAYRRASLDKSGAPIALLECPQAANLFFDLLQNVDPTGFSDFVRWVGEDQFRGFLNERLALEAVIKYKLQVFNKTRRHKWEVDEWSPGRKKLRIPHPDAPKELVLHALWPALWLEPGFYDFKLTAEVSLQCVGPFLLCGAAQIKKYVDLINKLRSGGLESVVASKILSIYKSTTGLPTTAQAAATNVITESGRNISRNASLRRYKVTPFEAAAEANNVLSPAIVPDVVEQHKCKAGQVLKGAGFRIALQTVTSSEEWSNQQVIATDPPALAEVRPASLVTLKIRDNPESEPIRCGLSASFKSVNKGVAQ